MPPAAASSGDTIRSVLARCCAAIKPGSTKFYCHPPSDDHKFFCPCGKEFGIDKDGFIKMVAKAFVYSGTKRNG